MVDEMTGLELGIRAEVVVGRHRNARHRQELPAMLAHAAAIGGGWRPMLGANHGVAGCGVGLEPGVELSGGEGRLGDIIPMVGVVVSGGMRGAARDDSGEQRQRCDGKWLHGSLPMLTDIGRGQNRWRSQAGDYKSSRVEGATKQIGGPKAAVGCVGWAKRSVPTKCIAG
jgi:hypothetical protein